MQAVAHHISEQWQKLPADRKGHSRRNIELFIAAIPDKASTVRIAVQGMIDSAEVYKQPPLELDTVATLVYGQLARWRIANPNATDEAKPFTGTARDTRTRETEKKPCMNCGADGKKWHHPRECPWKCPVDGCGVAYCGSGNGKECLLKSATMPKREKVLTGNGKPLVSYLYDKLVAKHALKYGTRDAANIISFHEEGDGPVNFAMKEDQGEDVPAFIGGGDAFNNTSMTNYQSRRLRLYGRRLPHTTRVTSMLHVRRKVK